MFIGVDSNGVDKIDIRKSIISRIKIDIRKSFISRIERVTIVSVPKFCPKIVSVQKF